MKKTESAGSPCRNTVSSLRYSETARPPFTFERNTLGSNGSFFGRFIADLPWRDAYPHARRSYKASRVGVAAPSLDLGRRAVGAKPSTNRPPTPESVGREPIRGST